jgi:hypothetical protein
MFFTQWWNVITSICYIQSDLEEPLLSKCENETTNAIVYRRDPNSYVINHMEVESEPPFSTLMYP